MRTACLGYALSLLAVAMLMAPALAEDLPPPGPGEMATSFQMPATYESGQIVAPVRPLCEALGCKVQWSPGTEEVTVSRPAPLLRLKLGRASMEVHERGWQTVALPLAPRFEHGEFVAPVKPLLAVLGGSATYDPATGLMTVNALRPAPGAELTPSFPLHVAVNGAPLPLPAPPRLERGRVVAPLRAVCQALGAEVGWEARAQQVVIRRAEFVVRLTPGVAKAEANGKPLHLSPAPAVENGLLVGPVGPLAEALGATVIWNAAEQMVNLLTLAAPPVGALTREGAMALATEYLKGLGEYPQQVTRTEASLGQAPANRYWESVSQGTPLPEQPAMRPAWIVQFTYTGLSPQDFKQVYVDAETGQVIGGTQSR